MSPLPSKLHKGNSCSRLLRSPFVTTGTSPVLNIIDVSNESPSRIMIGTISDTFPSQVSSSTCAISLLQEVIQPHSVLFCVWHLWYFEEVKGQQRMLGGLSSFPRLLIPESWWNSRDVRAASGKRLDRARVSEEAFLCHCHMLLPDRKARRSR